MRRSAVLLLAVLTASALASRASPSSPREGVIVFSATTPSLNLGRVQLYTINASGGKRVFLARHPAKVPVFHDAVPSPDRKLVAFVAQHGSLVDLFVMHPDGTGVRALTNTATVEANPSWSPDGRAIAVTLEDTGVGSQIAVVGVNGGSERIVAQGGLKPQFSPDGRTLLYVGDLVGNSPTGIHVVPVFGGPSRLVAHGNSPSWSHGSRRIAFVDAAGQLSILNVSTGAVHRLVRTGSPIAPPLWSPDDRTVAVATTSLSLVEVTSGQVEGRIGEAVPLAWSADGSKLALRRFSKQLAVLSVSSGRIRALTMVEPQGEIVRAWWLGPKTLAFGLTQTYSPLGLFTIRPDGSGVKVLTHSDLDSFDPAWSLDGSSIAFTRSDGPRSTIWKMDASGANLRQLTPWRNGVRDSQPAWSPDGLRIAFARNIGGSQGSALMVMEDDGSLTAKVGLDPVLAPRSAPSWSADGKQIAWQRAIYAADGSGSQPIDASAADVWSPSYSPDGTKLAYMRYRDFNGSLPQLIEKDLKTATLKLLTTKPSPFGGVYSPDSMQVAFISQPGGSGSVGVSVVSIGGGDERALLATGIDTRSDFLTEPSWSPDGLHLVVPASTNKTDLVIVNTDLTLPTEIGFGAQETLQAAWQPAPH